MKKFLPSVLAAIVGGWLYSASGGAAPGGLRFNAYTTNSTADVDARIMGMALTNNIPAGVVTNNQSGVTLRGMTNRNGLTVIGAQSVTGTLSANGVTSTNGVTDKTNPKFYGATGDGSHDDTTALASVISGATSYGLVTIPAGTYKVTSAISLDGVREIRGAGQFQTIIKAATPGMDVLHIGNSAAAGRIMVSDLCIDGNGLAQNGVVVANTNGSIYARGGIQDCLIQNCRGDGILVLRTVDFSVERVISRWNMNGLGSYFVGGVEATTAYFNACDFSSNTNNGVYLDFGRNFVFQNCIMEDNGGPGFTGLAAELLKIDSCWFEFNNTRNTYSNIAHVMFLPGGANYPTRVTICGNMFGLGFDTNQAAIYFGEGDYSVYDNLFYKFPTAGTFVCSNSTLVTISGRSSYDSTYPYFGPNWLFTNALIALGPLPNISWRYSGRETFGDTSTLSDSLWLNGGTGGLLMAYGTYATTNGALPQTKFPPSSITIFAPLALTNTSVGYFLHTTNNALELYNLSTEDTGGETNGVIGVNFTGFTGPMARFVGGNNPRYSYGGFFELWTYDAVVSNQANLVLYADHAGRLGVGTNSPGLGYKLDVAGPVNATAYYQNGVPFTSGSNTSTNLYVYDDLGALRVQVDTNGMQVFGTGTTTLSNVAIISPLTIDGVDVSGITNAAILSGTNRFSGTNTFTILSAWNESSGGHFIIGSSNNLPATLTFEADYTDLPYPNYLWNLIEQPSGSQYRFDIACGSDPYLSIINKAGTHPGFVGIGNSDPGELLDVAGNIKASGGLTAGMIVGSYGCMTMATGTVTVATSTSTNQFQSFSYGDNFGSIGIETNSNFVVTNAARIRVSFGCSMLGGNTDLVKTMVFTNGVHCGIITFTKTMQNPAKDETGFKEFTVSVPAMCRIGLWIANTAANNVNIQNLCFNVKGAN